MWGGGKEGGRGGGGGGEGTATRAAGYEGQHNGQQVKMNTLGYEDF